MSSRQPHSWQPRRLRRRSAGGYAPDMLPTSGEHHATLSGAGEGAATFPTGIGGGIPGLKGLRKVPWQDLPDHAIVIGGANINGAPPPELLSFPPIDSALRGELLSRYRFLHNHAVLIAEAHSPVEAVKLSGSIRALFEQVTSLRTVLGSFEAERRRILQLLPSGESSPADGSAGDDFADSPLWSHPRVTEASRLVKDQYASFTLSLAPEAAIPSFLRGAASKRISVAELLIHKLAQERFIPNDLPVRLHLALDCSYSMKRRGKLDYGVGAVNQLATALRRMLQNTEVLGYAFSSQSRRIDLPVNRIALPATETIQASLFQTVLKNRAPAKHNKLVLVTDGEPSDVEATLRMAEKLREERIDYTQILLHQDDELKHVTKDEHSDLESTDGLLSGEFDFDTIARTLTPEELEEAKGRRFDTFTRIAQAAGGNQIVLTLYDALSLLSLEVYDRYLGLLTLLA